MTKHALPTVTLTAYNLAPGATKADFDAWTTYVTERIDGACGFVVQVDAFGFEVGPADDQIETIGDTVLTVLRSADDDVTFELTEDEQRNRIQDALRFLWDNFCEPSA